MSVTFPRSFFAQNIYCPSSQTLHIIVKRVALPIFALLAGIFVIKYWRSKPVDISDPKSDALSSYFLGSKIPQESLRILGLTHQPMVILLFKEDLQRRPIFHLEALCRAIQANPSKDEDYRMMVQYLKGKPRATIDPSKDREEAIDTGGISRDYLDELAKGLTKRLSSYFTGKPQALIPSAVKLNNSLIQVFKNMGSLMMYCYHAKDEAPTADTKLIISRLIGRHFDDALFHCVLSLNAEDIDAPTLTSEAKIKVCRALVKSRVDEGEELGWLALRLRQIETNPPILNCEKNIQKFIDSLGINRPKKNVQTIINNPQKFIEEAICCVVEKSTKIDPKKMFEPIHAIAQGMKEFCCPERGDSLRRINNRWNEIINGIDYRIFSAKVQGALLTSEQRQLIIDSVVVSAGCNDKITTDVDRLKQWIVNPSTTEEDIRLFLKFATGATAPLSGQKIVVQSRECKGVVPYVSTCAYTLTFPTEYPNDISSSQAGTVFIKLLTQEMRRTVNEFDSK